MDSYDYGLEGFLIVGASKSLDKSTFSSLYFGSKSVQNTCPITDVTLISDG